MNETKPRVWPQRLSYVCWVLGFANLGRGTTSHLIAGGVFLLLAFVLAFWARRGVTAPDGPAAPGPVDTDSAREIPG
jgi:hypothetical protein